MVDSVTTPELPHANHLLDRKEHDRRNISVLVPSILRCLPKTEANSESLFVILCQVHITYSSNSSVLPDIHVCDLCDTHYFLASCTSVLMVFWIRLQITALLTVFSMPDIFILPVL